MYQYHTNIHARSEMQGEEWIQYEIYLDKPVADEERGRLIQQLQGSVRTKEDKELALELLKDIIKIDDIVTPEEQYVLDEVKRAMEEVGSGLFHQLNTLVMGAVNRRSNKISVGPNRERYLEEYLTNKVYYEVRRRLDVDDDQLNIDGTALRKLSATAGLMAKVAQVDRELTESEFETMKKALEKHWTISQYEAAFVAEVALSEAVVEIDYLRLTREFVTYTSAAERARFLDTLFDIADADGFVSEAEIEEIRKIAANLMLSSHSVQQAKRRIPTNRRFE